MCLERSPQCNSWAEFGKICGDLCKSEGCGERGEAHCGFGGWGVMGVGRLETILIQCGLLIYKHCDVAVLQRK